MNTLKSIICFMVVSISMSAQNTNQIPKDTLLKGKISVETNDVDGVSVVNLTTKSATISANGGYFTLRAKENDTLQFSALHLETKKYILKNKDLKNNLLLIQLNIHVELLKEVTVTNDGISAESLGIIPAGQKKYTTAERRLHTANSGIGFDPLLNWISGRTTQLKNEVALEEKERLQNKIASNYEKEYLINVLHIPEAYTNGFLFYIAEDKDLAEAVKLKNKANVEFRLIELATLYLKILPINTEK